MPKQSKVKVQARSTKPKQATQREDDNRTYYCCRCNHQYKHQQRNFPASQSPLYRGNNGYLPICNTCIDEIFEHYKTVLENETEALKRVCLKFDIYWNPEIYQMTSKANTSASRVRSYTSKTNLYKYVGKTFDDTLDEERAERSSVIVDQVRDISDTEIDVSPESVEFWGAGFEMNYYPELDRKYKNWTEDIPKPIEKAVEALYKQICILEITINRDSTLGKNIDKNVNMLNTLLGSLNAKPSQKKADEAMDAEFDKKPFGVGIRMYENSRPIPEPSPELRDVDGIIRYISIWFYGHACKMLKIKNVYSKMYEEELEKLRVENPMLDEEDDEAFFEDIYGGDLK